MRNYFLMLIFILVYGQFIILPFHGIQGYIYSYLIDVLILVVLWPDRHVLLKKPEWPSYRLWLFCLFFFIIFRSLENYIYTFDITYKLNELVSNKQAFPPIENDFLLLFDLTIGLMLVAIVEELVFRYKINEILEKRNFGLPIRYLITSFLFSLIHFSQGLMQVGITFIWGLFLFFIYQKTKTIHFVIIIHYIINFLIFGSFNWMARQ